MLLPKLFTTLKAYTREQFVADIMAGIIVGIVALPLAIAFGIASGVTPEKGLITAIVAGFLISALGGSRVQIGGPTGAFVVIVYGIVHHYGTEGLIAATFLAGILLIIMGFSKMGDVIKFVPHPLIVGFTSGIALIIFSSQVKDFLGLSMTEVPVEFIHKWVAYVAHLGGVNTDAIAIGIGTVLITALWPRVSRKIPGSLMALVLSALVVKIFHLPVETIGSRFGDLPASLPAPHFPVFSFSLIQQLIKPAFTIAILGAIESLLSAVVADGMIGGRHRSNMELVAQGAANIASSLFGGIPATGAIARTATNIKNGGRTPVAGMVHAVTLLLILYFAGKWAKLIPLSCLAGILVIVSYHMSEWRSFISLLRGPKSDVVILLITFLLTVLVDLTVAIEIGMVLSAFLFMRRMSLATRFLRVTNGGASSQTDEESLASHVEAPEGVEIYEIEGPLFFGVSHQFEEAMRTVAKKPKVQILLLRYVPVIDATGLHSLRQFYKKCKAGRIQLLLSGVHSQPLKALKSSGLYDEIGSENIFPHIEDAVQYARQYVSAAS